MKSERQNLERRQAHKLEALVAQFAKLTLDLVFPLHCLGCQREGAVICAECVGGLKRLERPYCDRCAQPNSGHICAGCLERPLAVDTVRAPFLFEGPIREAVHRLKYRGQRAAAAQPGQLMAESAAGSVASVDVAVPVPVHSSRLRRRGYNQSLLLARELGKTLGLPVEDGLLSKVKNSPPQVQARSREDRQSNVLGSFECRSRWKA